MWRRDKKGLFYLTPDNGLTAVELKTDSSEFRAGVPHALFQTQLIPGGWRNRYVVSPHGQRFLVPVRAGECKSEPIAVVINWLVLLKKQ